MKWLRENISLIGLLTVIVSLSVYIYQEDRSRNKEEHQKIEAKVDKIIEKMDNDQTQRYDRWEQLISDIQDSLKRK